MTRRKVLVRGIGYVALVMVASLVVASEGGDVLALVILAAVVAVSVVAGAALWRGRSTSEGG